MAAAGTHTRVDVRQNHDDVRRPEERHPDVPLAAGMEIYDALMLAGIATSFANRSPDAARAIEKTRDTAMADAVRTLDGAQPCFAFADDREGLNSVGEAGLDDRMQTDVALHTIGMRSPDVQSALSATSLCPREAHDADMSTGVTTKTAEIGHDAAEN